MLLVLSRASGLPFAATTAAKRHADEHPEDFAGASAKYREAVAAGKGTAVELEADAALVALDERWIAVAGEALAAAKEKVAALVEKIIAEKVI